MSNVEARVKAIIVNQLGVEESAVVSKAKFSEDLGADSLDIAELVMVMEDTFSTTIPDKEAEKIKTVGDAVNYLHQVDATV